jgi:hypothetical protein
MEDAPCPATDYARMATYSLGRGGTNIPAPPNGGAMNITSGRIRSEEVHHIGRRVDLDAFGDDGSSSGLRSFYVRASGYVLLVTMAAVICYSATL